jgi:hypothetical protein
MEELIIYILFLLVRVKVLKTDELLLNIDPVAPIYWVDKDEIFVNEKSRSYIYDVSDREIKKTYEKSENELWGIDKGATYLCIWENREINSADEFSTHLIVKNEDGNKIINTELKPTVEVWECGKSPVLKTVYPLEEKYFIFTNQLYELESPYESQSIYKGNKVIIQDKMNRYWLIEFKLF